MLTHLVFLFFTNMVQESIFIYDIYSLVKKKVISKIGNEEHLD